MEPNEQIADVSLQEMIRTEKSRRRRRRGWLIGGIILVLLAIGCLGICVAAMNMNTIFSGTSVLGVDMGKLTRQQAEDRWKARLADTMKAPRLDITLDEDTIYTMSLRELGASISSQQAAQTAWDACHSGDFFMDGFSLARSWFVAQELVPDDIASDEKTLDESVAKCLSGFDFTLVDGAYVLDPDGQQGSGLYLTKPRDGKQIDSAKLEKDLQKHITAGDLSPVPCTYTQQTAKTLNMAALYNELHGDMVNSLYDHSTGKPSESCIGVEFDVAVVSDQLDKAKDGSTFKANAQVEFPTVSQEFLEENMFRDVLGTCTTTVSGSSTRIGNVKLAAQICDGHVYNPGEEFWYNATVGQRTVERGFGAAPAYFMGETVMEVGGGICQVSSTLYYAALLADMRIVLRYAHQYAPAYITFGCDATVSWNGPDFAFANSSPYPIKIVMGWENNQLTMTILGTKTDDTYVKMESYTRSSTPYQVEYRYNADLVGSDDVTVQTAYTGYFVETFRCHYTADGTLISRVYEDKSDYDSRDAIIETGDYDKIQRLYQASLN